MGMFDIVTSEYRGIAQHIEFQTKDFSNDLDRYHISFDGKLLVRKFSDDYKTQYSSQFSGTVNIYGTIPNIGRSIEFEIDFIEGYVVNVEKIM